MNKFVGPITINGKQYRDVPHASAETGISRSTIHSRMGRENSRDVKIILDGGRSLKVWCDGEEFPSRVTLSYHLGFNHGTQVNKMISLAKKKGAKSVKIRGRLITWEAPCTE